MKFFSLIEEERVHLAPDQKVIPAKEFSKLVKAHAILKEVKEQEATYRDQITHECEVLKEQAELAGFEEGLKQWNAQLEQLDLEIKRVRDDVENALVPLALTAVKKIIGKELATDPETIVEIISTALKAVTQHRKIKIYVNPQDQKIVEKARPHLITLFAHLDSLSIISRADIEEGGCVIETEVGIINAQLDSQLKALEAAFHAFFHPTKKEVK